MFISNMCSIDCNCVSNNPYKNNIDMKANEAPKSKFVYPNKLYARTKDNITLDISYAPQTMEAVEYTRADAFIEKACEWLEPVLKNYAGYYVGKDILGNFKNYMEGE